MRKKQLILNVFLLSATSMILKLAGMVFKIYISGKLGAEGMGVYQLIFSVYALMISISCAGVQISTTRMVSEQVGKNEKKRAHTIVKIALCYVCVLSIAIASSVFFLSDYIAKVFLHNQKAAISLKILCFALIPVAFSTCFKGFFTSKSEIYKISLSQIIEDFLKIFTVIYIFGIIEFSDKYIGCSVIMLAILLSEIASCIFLALSYLFDSNKQFGKSENKKSVLPFCTLTLTLAIGSIIGNILHTAENFLIPSGLKKYGLTLSMALEKYGMLKGMTMPVLLFPSALITSFSSLLIPEITRADVLSHRKTINSTITKSLRVTLILSVFIMGVFISFSNEIGCLLYKNREVGSMISSLSFFIPFMYLDGMIFTMLTALNMQKYVLRISIIDSLLRLIMIYVLVPKFGFNAIIFTMYVSNLLTPICGIIILIKNVGLVIKPSWILCPFASIFASKYIADTLLSFFADGLESLVFIGAGCAIMGIVYAFLLLISGSISGILYNFER